MDRSLSTSQLTSLLSGSGQMKGFLCMFSLLFTFSWGGSTPFPFIHLYLFKSSLSFNIRFKGYIFQEARCNLFLFLLHVLLLWYLPYTQVVYFFLHLGNFIKGETGYNISVSEFLTLSKFPTFNQSLLTWIECGCYLKCTRLIFKKRIIHFLLAGCCAEK